MNIWIICVFFVSITFLRNSIAGEISTADLTCSVEPLPKIVRMQWIDGASNNPPENGEITHVGDARLKIITTGKAGQLIYVGVKNDNESEVVDGIATVIAAAIIDGSGEAVITDIFSGRTAHLNNGGFIAFELDPRLNWRTSIIDLLKFLLRDSSYEARRRLARELGYTFPTNESISMNIWLHRKILERVDIEKLCGKSSTYHEL
jgi:hypothetical protein